MSNIALLLLCLVAGALLRRFGQLPAETPRAINRFIIYLSLPALVLLKVTPLVRSEAVGWKLLLPISVAWVLFAVAFVLFAWLGRQLGWSSKTTGAMVLSVGLGNTLFVGYPLLEWLLGPSVLPLAVLVDQLGSFLVLSTLAVIVAAFFGGGAPKPSELVRRVVTFPPFVALIVAAIWGLVGDFRLATGMTALLEKLSVTLVPLAIFSVGASLRVDRALLVRRWRQVTLGLAFKLVLFPLSFVVLYGYLFGMRGMPLAVTILQSAMAPMATSAVLVAEFGLDEELAGLLLGLGIPLSILTVFAWNEVLLVLF